MDKDIIIENQLKKKETGDIRLNAQIATNLLLEKILKELEVLNKNG